MSIISPNITKKISVSTNLVVSVDEVGQWLNLSPSAIIKNNDLLEGLIKTTTEIIENYSWLSLRQTEYEAYYYIQTCNNDNLKLSLERSPILDLDNITKIEYLNNDTWVEFNRGAVTIDGLYENTTEKQEQREWASIKFREDIPFQNRCNAYQIRITFTAGWNPTETDPALKVPDTIKLAIKKIVAFYYTNRGDCDTKCNINGYPVPCDAKGMIDMISISNTIIGAEYAPAKSGFCYE